MPFQHKNITVFRSQFPLVPSLGKYYSLGQGLTLIELWLIYQRYLLQDSICGTQQGKNTGRSPILNYKKSAFRKDKRVEHEMVRLQSKAITLANWPIIPTLPAKQWIKICYLNIRGYLNHITDLKKDNNICTCALYSSQKLT